MRSNADGFRFGVVVGLADMVEKDYLTRDVLVVLIVFSASVSFFVGSSFISVFDISSILSLTTNGNVYNSSTHYYSYFFQLFVALLINYYQYKFY